MSSDYLKIEFLTENYNNHDNFKYRSVPFAINNNEIIFSPIKKAQKMTENQDVKTVYTISFDLQNIRQDFLPGDTIGILPSNKKMTVDKILSRLNLTLTSETPCEVKILKETTKKNPSIPKHLPLKTTLKEIFLNHVDIQTPPKKLFLKSLLRFTQNPEEVTKLEEICSPKSSKQYTELITTSGKTLLGLLDTFPSCQPSVEALLEHLPPLQPRPYSICSSSLSGHLEVTFFVLEHEDGRKGVCTGWLEDLILRKSANKVGFYFREPTRFRLTQEVSNPVILVATGTGIAPFRGFLQHLKIQKCQRNIWLFYGCKYENRDFLFKEEILDFLKTGVLTRLELAFSRQGPEKTYVQHCISRCESEFLDWVTKGASIFICGDLKTVVKDVRSTMGEILSKIDSKSIENSIQGIESKGRFVVDRWA